jgi:hypothetical protein
MTITAQTSKTGPYSGNGSTVDFDFTFYVHDADDLVVILLDAAGVQTTLTYLTDYTVVGAGNQNGGTVTVAVAPELGEKLIIARSVDLTQEMDLQNLGEVSPEELEDAFDKLTQIVQDQQEQLSRAIKVDRFGTTTADQLTAYINALGPIADDIVAVSNIDEDVVAVADNAVDISAVADINLDVTAVANISGAVSAVAADAADIGTVAADIADVSTVAGISASVMTVAGISSAVVAVAADAADIGAVAAIAADVSAVADITGAVTTVAGIDTEVSAVAAIAADVTVAAANVADITNFADVYLGPSATEPTQRADASALQAGDLYFDTVVGYMRVYDGTVWTNAYEGGDVTFDSVHLTGGVGDQGTISWNADEETLDLIQNGAVLQLGQETQVHVRNNSGATIGNGVPVMATGTLGASGRITVAKMDGTVPTNAIYMIGIATEDIPNGTDGKVTVFGKVRSVNTNDTAIFTGTIADGDVLYIDPDTAGKLTKTAPAFPKLHMPVAFVIHAASNGTIMVRVTPVNENEFQPYSSVLANTTASFTTADETKLDNIEAGADVTDAVNVAAALSVSGAAAGELLSWNGTAFDWVAAGGTGTVTSVGMSVPTGLSVSGSPITTTGTLALTYSSGYQGYTTTEASKLSGIEAGADVTDATNVAAAGALMASNNLSDVSSANVALTNLVRYQTIATAGGTTTLTATSPSVTIFTGSTTQTLVLPDVSTLQLGMTFTIINTSTGAITPQSSGGNSFTTISGSGMSARFVVVATTGTGTASWVQMFDGSTARSGGGQLVFSSGPTLFGPLESVTATVTAGTNAQGQGQIATTTGIVVVTTAASNPSGVTLSASSTGRRIVIINQGANPVNVYPPSGSQIDALGANNPFSLPVGDRVEFNCVTSTLWYSSAYPVIYGGAIDGTPIGATTASTVRGTTLTATTEVRSANYKDASGGNTALINGITPLSSTTQSMVLLGTLTTTSGTTQTLSGLTLTSYASLYITVDGASHNGGTSGGLTLGTGLMQNTNRSSADLVGGFIVLPLGTGQAVGFIYRDTETNAPRVSATGYSTASTSLSFTWSNGAAFDAGTIKVYGVKA